MQNQRIRIGTRGSKLALLQTDLVIAAWKKAYPEYDFEKVVLSTRGDRIKELPLQEFGGKGAFVEEFESALIRGEIDAAVHSAKDMPACCREGTCIAGVLPAASSRDVLVTIKGGGCIGKSGMYTETNGEHNVTRPFVAGTSSGRRKMQFLSLYPDAVCRNLRGNVHTRIEKLRWGEYDGIILAEAGLERLGLAGEPDLCYEPFSVTEMVPAAGQGIIAVQTMPDSRERQMFQHVSDAGAFLRLTYERSVVKSLQAGCHDPVGVHVKIEGEEMEILLMNGMSGTMQRKQLRGAVRDGVLLVEEICR